MKLPFARPIAGVRGASAFTLIELLAVMAIILVLAGLIISIAGNANYNSAKARAKSEIKAMETALENYKADNGAYPTDPSSPAGSGSTDTLDARLSYDPTNNSYLQSSQVLYQALAGFVLTTGANGSSTFNIGKKYMDFTPSQLHADAAHNTLLPSSTSPYMYIIDPFGFSYGYSTAYAAAYSKDSTKTPTVGYNPTFDLWSTAGYAKGGKSTPTNMQGADDASKYSTLWEKNW